LNKFKPNDLPKKYREQIKNKNKSRPKNEGESKLIIPGELPTQNEMVNKSKTHWNKYRDMKEKYEEMIIFYIEQQEIPFYESIHLDITYYRTNRRHDPDNIVAAKKIILDAFQKIGVIENDGWKQVKGFTESWEVDKENPRTEIKIKKREEY